MEFSSEYDMANQFNQHFINAGPNLANTITNTNENPTSYISNSPVSSFVMSSITETQVQSLFLTLDSTKAFFDIPNTMIKKIAPIISPVFTSIYNESINKGIVPYILKISQVTSIYKSGTITNPSNYRPISVLDCQLFQKYWKELFIIN